MNERLETQAAAELDALRAAGTLKVFNDARVSAGPGRARWRAAARWSSSRRTTTSGSRPARGRPRRHRRAHGYGAGTASVRFICGTFAPHLELERDLATFSGTESALTYVSCWNANEALIPTLADAETVILSDALNHASIIDAVRLAKPERKVRLRALEHVGAARGAGVVPRDQRKLIVTDGVFSMEGDVARLPEIVELAARARCGRDRRRLARRRRSRRDRARRRGALRPARRDRRRHRHARQGSRRRRRRLRRASAAVCELLAQRSRPQLFSNALPPTVACSARAAIGVLRAEPELVRRLHANVAPLPRSASRGWATRRSTATRRSSRSSSARRPARSRRAARCSTGASS